MQIKQLEINNVRIIQKANIKTCPNINLFIGKNASGKTSILEAISILATTRSFRTDRASQVICHHKNDLIVRAIIKDEKNIEHTIGIKREKDNNYKISIDFSLANRRSLANTLSIQIINPKVSDLILAGSKARRDFLDWGVFHVKHLGEKHLNKEYSNRKNLSQFKKVLKQRNLCLRHFASGQQQIKAWTDEFIKTSEILGQARQQQLLSIDYIFNTHYSKFLNLSDINFKYYQGWSEEKSLGETLKNNFKKDKKRGTTTAGPHLADLKIMSDGHNAKDVLSRGQTKLLSFLLRLSQMHLFIEKQQKTPVLLLDDVSAELDGNNRKIVMNCLNKLKIQTFMTATSVNQIILDVPHKMFHVKHGEISEYKK